MVGGDASSWHERHSQAGPFSLRRNVLYQRSMALTCVESFILKRRQTTLFLISFSLFTGIDHDVCAAINDEDDTCLVLDPSRHL